MSVQQYSTGLCDCGPFSVCFESICCGTCQLSRQAAALAGDKDTCTIGGCLYACCCMPCAQVTVRTGIVNRYKLDDSLTCCKALCCGPCSTCQNHRELTIRGDWPGGMCMKQPYEMK
jgi:Cys-rich protein (TIGR01571 family)